ncbi:MAG: hypothetical protein IKZ62_00970 [Prevotella sp.]|nr:hypothetical protein [Prevotella sp.]
MGLFIFLIKGWYKDATFSPVSYIVGVVLFILLSFQCVLVVGSLKIINMSDDYENRISAIVDNYYSPSEEVSTDQASDVINTIIDEYPILHYYVSGGHFSGYTAKELPHAIVQSLRSFMHWYVFRRILWCLAFVIIGAIFVIKTLSKSYSKQKRNRPQYSRQRVSRRRKY